MQGGTRQKSLTATELNTSDPSSQESLESVQWWMKDSSMEVCLTSPSPSLLFTDTS